jgi:hypothetical protein
MEESQRSAASVDKTADPRPTGIRGEAARASAMDVGEESPRSMLDELMTLASSSLSASGPVSQSI